MNKTVYIYVNFHDQPQTPVVFTVGYDSMHKNLLAI